MNKPMVIVVALLVGLCVLDAVIEILNLRSWPTKLPEEFNGYYEPGKYETSQKYLAEKTILGLGKEIFTIVAVVLFIVMGGFQLLDAFTRGFQFGPIISGLIFTGIIVLALFVLNLPFEAYGTFVIEQKYGFNTMTAKTFWLDTFKMLFLNAVIGAILLAVILWIFEKGGRGAWVYCWLAVSVIQIFLMYVAPVVILPLFNKFSPMEEGTLKTGIKKLAQAENFEIEGIYVMDGSRRSTKANAALTGFGRYKRVMLYDTLMKKMAENEIVAVLAHEIGHYKYKHIIKFLVLSLAVSAIVFFAFSCVNQHPLLFQAFGISRVSLYAGLMCFMIVLIPIQRIGGVFTNWLSRSNEYEADRFAAQTTRKPEDLVTALKKLTSDSMANLNPHPLKVWFDYSHPPVLERIRALRKIGAAEGGRE